MKDEKEEESCTDWATEICHYLQQNLSKNIKRHGHDSKKTMKSGRKIWKKVFNSDFDIPEKMQGKPVIKSLCRNKIKIIKMTVACTTGDLPLEKFRSCQSMMNLTVERKGKF